MKKKRIGRSTKAAPSAVIGGRCGIVKYRAFVAATSVMNTPHTKGAAMMGVPARSLSPKTTTDERKNEDARQSIRE